MTSQSGQLQALITEIEALLTKAAPKLPWVMSGEANEQRRVMEQVLVYLQAVQATGVPSPGWGLTPTAGAAIAPTAGESTDVAGTNSQQVLQALLQEMQYLRVQMVQPLTNEVMALQQQREALKNEVRQLEIERLQRSESANANALNPAWMDDVVGRLSAVLLEQLTPQFRALRSQIDGAPALYGALPPDAAAVAAELPPLNPQQRLEQLRQIQAQTDHLLLRLDGNLRTVFESLDQSIQSYCDTLNQGLDAMHGLGQQGEFVFRTFINHLAEQLQDESSYLISRPEQARLTGQERATPDRPVRSTDADFSDRNLDALDLSNVDLSALDLDVAVEADEEVTLFQLDEELTDLPVDDLDDDPDEMPEWVEPDPGEATMVQTEPISWAVVTGQAAAAANDASAEAPATDAYTEEIDSLYDSLFGTIGAAASIPAEEELDEADEAATAAVNEPLFTLDQSPETLEPTSPGSTLTDAPEAIAPTEPAETALESLLEVAESTPAADDTATPLEPPAALENLLGIELAEELASVGEAQNESDDIITSLSELLPTTESGQSPPAADPFAAFEESEDTFIAAPPEENLLDAPAAASGTTLDFTLDEATLGQLTSDLSQLEGFAASTPEWPMASPEETATVVPASQTEVGWTSADDPSLVEAADDGDTVDDAQDAFIDALEPLEIEAFADDRELPDHEPEVGPTANTVEADLGSGREGLFVDEPESAPVNSLDDLSLAEAADDEDEVVDKAQDTFIDALEPLGLDNSIIDVDDHDIPERESEANSTPNTVEADLGSDLDGLFADEPEIATANSLDDSSLAEADDVEEVDEAQDAFSETLEPLGLDDSVVNDDDRELPDHEPETGSMPNPVEVDQDSGLEGLFADEPESAPVNSLDALVSELTSEPGPAPPAAIADDLDRESSASAHNVADASATETAEDGPDAWLADLDLDGLDADLDADLPGSGDAAPTSSAPTDAAEAIALANIFGDDATLSAPISPSASDSDLESSAVDEASAKADDRRLTVADAFGSEIDDLAEPLSDVPPETSPAADVALNPPVPPTTAELALTLEEAIPLELELPDFSDSLLEIASEAADSEPTLAEDTASLTLDDDFFPDDGADDVSETTSTSPPAMPANPAVDQTAQDWSKYVSDEPDEDGLLAAAPEAPQSLTVESDTVETAEDFFSLGDLDLDLSLDLDAPVSDSETSSTAAELFADFPDDLPAPAQPPAPTLPLTGSVSDGFVVEADTAESEQTLANLIAAIPENESDSPEVATTAEFTSTTAQNEDEALSAALDNLAGLDLMGTDQAAADSDEAAAIAPLMPELDEAIAAITDASDPAAVATASDGFWTPEMEEQMAADFAAASESIPDADSTPDDAVTADLPGPLSDDELANLFPPQPTDDTVTVAPLDNLAVLLDADGSTVPAPPEMAAAATPEEDAEVDPTSADPLTFRDDDNPVSSPLEMAAASPEDAAGVELTSEDPLTFLPEDTDFGDLFPPTDEATPAPDAALPVTESASTSSSVDADLTSLNAEDDTPVDSELEAEPESTEAGATFGIDWDPMESDFGDSDRDLAHDLDSGTDEPEGFAASPLFEPLEPSSTEIFPDAENSDQTSELDSLPERTDDDLATSPLFEPLDLSMAEIPAADLAGDEAFRSAFDVDLDLPPAIADDDAEDTPEAVDVAVALDSDRGEDPEAPTVTTELDTELADETKPVAAEETPATTESRDVIARDPIPPLPVEPATPATPEAETADESLAATADESLFASSGQLAAIPSAEPDEPDDAVDSGSGLIEEWFLGLDFGSGGLSAVLMEQGSGTAHPLCWLAESEADNPGAATFRPATVAAFRPSASDQGALSELLAVGPAALPQQPPESPETWLLQSPRPLLKVGMPYQTAAGEWAPVIQWADAQTVSLQQVLTAVTALLSLITQPGELELHRTAVGLDDEMLSEALASLQGVVLGLPSNWSDTYSLNIREAVLGAGLVESSSQIFFVEEAIAALLSGLPDPNEPPPESNRQTQTLYQCTWQGGTVVISSGATCTDVGIVDLPQPLDALSREDFKLRNLAYGGDALDLDIICQLLIPAERRQTVPPNASRQARDGWSWQATLPEVTNAHWDDLHLEALDLPQLAEPDTSARIHLRQRLEASRLGQSLLEAARYLKLILQNQNHYQLELADQSWRVLRRDLESRVLVPYIQRLNQQLNALLSQTGLASQGINQVICTGGNASFNAIAKWLRQKFPNATIIQDTYPSNRPQTCSRVAYGLANLCRYPQLLDVPRHQYSDYFLLNEMIRTVPDTPMPFEGILHLLEEQGVNTDVCQSRIAAILEGHLPPGLRPDASTQDYLSRATLASATYQELAATALFTKQTRQIYVVNPQQRDRLHAHLAALMQYKQQSLTEPMIAQLVTL
ncbi:MAG: hypothetical protein ACFB12_28165 [Leptolyngbyaceae cyanobacterium]